MKYLIHCGGVLLIGLAMAACKPKAEAETRYNAPPEQVMPTDGWRPATIHEAGVAEAGKHFEPGVTEIADDFDGDGRPDTAKLVVNDKAGLFAVDIQLSSGAHQRLASGPIAQLKAKVLRRVGKGRHTRNCGYYNAVKGASIRCGPVYADEIELQQRAVSLFDYQTKDSTYVLWQDGKLQAMLMDGPDFRAMPKPPA